MIRIPILLLTYGQFTEENQKVFAYESQGVLILPLFDDPERVFRFKSAMQSLLEQYHDKRNLTVQICNKAQSAIDMITFAMTLEKETQKIIINAEMQEGNITGSIYEIDEVLSELSNLVRDRDLT